MDDHRGALDRLADALLEAETLSRDQIEDLLGERSAPPARMRSAC
jgi:ATP-dependent Zn protease